MMKARILLFIGLALIITGLVVYKNSHKETISLVVPSGYSVAQKIEEPKEEAFVSALEYAQAFQASLPQVQEQAPTPKVAKLVKKHTPKRHIAKVKTKNHKLVARR